MLLHTSYLETTVPADYQLVRVEFVEIDGKLELQTVWGTPETEEEPLDLDELPY